MFLRSPSGLDDFVLEDMVDAYVEWRQQAWSVWAAYQRWSRSTREETIVLFAAYTAALDQEQRASEVYEAAVSAAAAAIVAAGA